MRNLKPQLRYGYTERARIARTLAMIVVFLCGLLFGIAVKHR